MTRTRYRIFETEYPYFMTCTAAGWLPIFTRPETTEIVFESWRFLQCERDLKLFGYVILENHLHFIASAPKLSTAIQNFKSFTARRIIDYCGRSWSTPTTIPSSADTWTIRSIGAGRVRGTTRDSRD